MTIRTRLTLGAIICIGLASLFAAFLISSAQQVGEANEENALAGKLAKGMSELQILTNDYILHYEERAETQWYQKHDSITELLAVGENTQGKAVHDGINHRHELIKNIFTQLTMFIKERQSLGSEGTGLYEERENRLISQLLIESQMMASEVHELQLLTQVNLDAAQRRILFSVIGFASAVGAVIAVVVLWIRRSVLSPLGKLVAGTEKVGSGDLDYRLGFTTRDELGQLSRAFDQMTENLKRTTTSIDDLNKEITERKQAEEALWQSEQRYRTLVESMVDVVFTLDSEGKFTYLNQTFQDATDYSIHDLIGHSFIEILAPEYIESTVSHFRQGLSGETIPLYEVELLLKNGERLSVELNVTSLLDAEGQTIGRIGIARDITERKQAEEKIKASLAEKELLLKEVHHRVKNNMQVISSLLKLGAGAIKNKEDAAVFKDSQDRIKSMALVYNKLYQAEDLAHIDFREYVRELIRNLVPSYRAVAGKVTTSVECGDVSLGVDQAIPCGLVINELITNSLKYAFPSSRGGEIKVSLAENEGEVELTVSDNGVGIPASLDLAGSKTLGLRLVGNLVEQLGGKIELDRTAGTSFKITFRRNRE